MPNLRDHPPFSSRRGIERPNLARRRRVRPWVEELEAHVLLSTLVVNSPADDTVANDGKLTFREAILAANAAPGSTIQFALPDPSVAIKPTTALPFLTAKVTIDGYTQSGASKNTNGPGLADNAVLKVVLNGALADPGYSTQGLYVLSDDSAIRGLVIDGFSGNGIVVQGARNVVEGDFLGTDAAGTTAVTNGGAGVSISTGAVGNTIGGTTAGARNVISGNRGDAVQIVGGLDAGDPTTTGNVVAGNFLGTDITGTTITGLDGNPLGNGAGVSILFDTSGNTVGGTTAAARNVISGGRGSFGTGIFLGDGASSNAIQGNFIGTDRTGNVSLGNGGSGVQLTLVAATDNLIGGLTATPGQAPGNVIVGSGAGGAFGSTNLALTGTGISGNLVQGNLIGLLANGTAAPNGTRNGVRIGSGATKNTIGGTAAGARNVISGNATNGIEINSAGTSNNVVQGNFIGTDPTGASAVPNQLAGVIVHIGATDNTIGGTAPGQGNLIAYNKAKGVVVGDDVTDLSTGNAILGNAIFSNVALGIDLANNGVTPNDSSGHTGPNLFQDFPVLTSAVATSSGTTVRGTVHGPANSTIRVEIFASTTADPSGHGQGNSFLDAVAVKTNSHGDGTFALAIGSIAQGSILSATATDASGNTSEFARDLRVVTDVTSRVGFRAFAPVFNRFTGVYSQTITLTNTGATTLSGPIQLVLSGLTAGVTLTKSAGTDPTGNPYVTAGAGDLAPGKSITIVLTFRKTSPGLYVNYVPKIYSGNFIL